MKLTVDETAKLNFVNTSLIVDGMKFSGCELTCKNINHPLVQKFFNQMGAKAEIYNSGKIKITGNVIMQGGDLHDFLMQNGVNLRVSPLALDLVVEQAPALPIANPDIPKKFTPGFDNAVKTQPPVFVKAAEPVATAVEDESLYTRIKNYFYL